ncbi:hypothetical protein GF324_13865 [bacterium]|nr:hypothetical protein [bacterium]
MANQSDFFTGAVDYLPPARERFQSAVRTVRLTMPPGDGSEFWPGILEAARYKQSGLAITLLIDPDLKQPEALENTLQALAELDKLGHEVSWSASEPFPYFLLIVDELSVLLCVGDTDSNGNGRYVHHFENSEQAASLRKAFDQRVAEGRWGIDPEVWLTWVRSAPRMKTVRRVLVALRKNEKRLQLTTRRALRKMPTRACWLLKPRDSAFGVPEPPGQHRWGEMAATEHALIGWPELAGLIVGGTMPKREDFRRSFLLQHPDARDVNRAYATLRHFVEEMLDGDRVATIEGWTVKQTSPVRFHGWSRIIGGVEILRDHPGWRLGKRTRWQRYELDLPVDAVREATGLQSSTHPIHRIHDGAFRRLLALAEEVRRARGDSQLMLDFTLVNSTPVPLGQFEDD